MYDIEDRARPLTAAVRRELRNVEAVPVLDRLDAYLTRLASYVLPKSALAKAVTYARNQWDALRCYTQDGRLTIDNNVSERTLRHQAIGARIGYFSAAKTRARGRPCCTRSWPVQNVIASNRGRTFENF